MMNAEKTPWIVRAMSEPLFYDHPVAAVEMIETHISWVFLAGDFAYKVKKPVNFGFLDFSTLGKRRTYCLEELRLNRRFSGIYLDLVSIGGRVDDAALHKRPVLEYAVKMLRFPQDHRLDRMLAVGRLSLNHILAFATEFASLHQKAAAAKPGSAFGSPDAVLSPVLENFEQLRPFLKGPAAEETLGKLEQWSHHSFTALQPSFHQRKTDGYIRECHGDVHLANMAWFDDRPLLFDCIEFNENLRWIDVVNDIAFLLMDLDDRRQEALGWGFLNSYLHETGDYPGLTLLNFYKTYRAMVRAKVVCLRLTQGHLNPTQRYQAETLSGSYLALAEQYTLRRATPLIITHGLSGAGKTTFSSELARRYGAIHLRADVERKRLYGLSATAASASPIAAGLYSAQASAATYSRLRDLAVLALHAGFPIIIDATFINQEERERLRRLAEDIKVPLILLDFVLTAEESCRRLERRRESSQADASEATREVVEYQLAHAEPLTAAEKASAKGVNADTGVAEVIEFLRSRGLPGADA